MSISRRTFVTASLAAAASAADLVDDFGAVQGGQVVFGSKEWGDPTIANMVIQASLPPFGPNTRSTILVGFGVSETRGTWS